MPGIKSVSFTSPYSVEEEEIQRRRRMADQLQAQASAPDTGTQMIGGWAIPKSPWEGLAKAAQGVSGAYQESQATDMAKALRERAQGDRASDMTAMAGMLRGSPGAPASSEQIVDEQAQGGMGEAAQINAPAMPARPGGQVDPQMISQLRSPEMQNMGMQMWAQQMQRENAPPKWEKADIRQPDGQVKRGYVNMNSPNPEATFRPLGTEPVKQEFVSGQPVNPYTRNTPVADPNALMSLGADGKPVLNQPLFDAKKQIAAKGAANVQVKTDVKTGESLAGQVGPMMKDSVAIAEGAVKQIDAARRITAAVDAGKIITGPTADARLVAAQIGQALGVGGKDDAEKIANTRQALRGLAELTLQGRQQMKGQGAITESEGKLAEKAMSGEISFTAAEIKQLAKASERAANFNLGEHQRKLKVMQGNPALQGIEPFYRGPSVPQAPGAVAPTPLSPATREFLKQQGIAVD